MNSIPPILPSSVEPPPVFMAPPQRLLVTSSTSGASRHRWRKRVLFLVCGLTLIGSVVWATSPRPRLSARSERATFPREQSFHEIVRDVDREMDQAIELATLSSSDAADWKTICRRLSLALIGNGLSLEDIRVLEKVPEEDRVGWWADYLLSDRRSADYLAERFTRATVGTNNGPFLLFRRRMYVDWIADQIAENVPYDRIVRQLITATGSWTDSPQVNFLTATMDENDQKQPDVIRLAGRTSRAFLAQRIDCLQCHQDYLGNVQFTESGKAEDFIDGQTVAAMRTGQQKDFHQLASFFAGTRMENPFVGLRNTDRDYRVRYLDESVEQSVSPEVPYDEQLLPEYGSQREKLAIWVTHPKNMAFARAAVNRTWAILFGRPWFAEIDNVPLAGPFPPGFEAVANDFIEHGYDWKRLIRVLSQLKAFQRDSRLSASEPTEEHEALWAVFPLTQLRPEQVAASIHQAARLKTIDEDSSIISKLELFGGVNDFTKAYGDQGDDEFQESAITIPQRLLVMNGTYTQERIKNNPIMNASTRIAEQTKDDLIAVKAIYLSVLNREPSGSELNAFCEKLKASGTAGRANVVEDIFWTLLNSTEFLWNH